MGLFDGWGSPSWGSQGMMGSGGNGFGGQSGGRWTPVQGQPGLYQNGNMIANAGQMPYNQFQDSGFYGQQSGYANPFAAFGGMTSQQPQPNAAGPVNQSGSAQPAQAPQSLFPNQTIPGAGISPYAAPKYDMPQLAAQGPANGTPSAPAGGGLSAFSRFGW